jgi:hypothetical protein
MEKPLKYFFTSQRNHTCENKPDKKWQFLAYGNYDSTANCRKSIRAILQGILGIFRGI